MNRLCLKEEKGVGFSNDIIKIIVNHGRYNAAKWAGHKDERQYWEARYVSAQAIYVSVLEIPKAYEDFNAKCGVTFKDGHIVVADGTICVD